MSDSYSDRGVFFHDGAYLLFSIEAKTEKLKTLNAKYLEKFRNTNFALDCSHDSQVSKAKRSYRLLSLVWFLWTSENDLRLCMYIFPQGGWLRWLFGHHVDSFLVARLVGRLSFRLLALHHFCDISPDLH